MSKLIFIVVFYLSPPIITLTALITMIASITKIISLVPISTHSQFCKVTFVQQVTLICSNKSHMVVQIVRGRSAQSRAVRSTDF